MVHGMFFACGIWCLADVSSVSASPSHDLSRDAIQETRSRLRRLVFDFFKNLDSLCYVQQN